MDHDYSSTCYCDECEAIGFRLAAEERAERREEEQARLAHRNAHPLVWR